MAERKSGNTERLNGLFSKLTPLAQRVHHSIITNERMEGNVPRAVMATKTLPVALKHINSVRGEIEKEIEEGINRKEHGEINNSKKIVVKLIDFYLRGGFGFKPPESK